MDGARGRHGGASRRCALCWMVEHPKGQIGWQCSQVDFESRPFIERKCAQVREITEK
jgi:hypothetical protein